MGTYDIIKSLAKNKRVSIAEIERKLNLSNGSISKWNASFPNSEPLQKVASYFGVSTDYLLGRTVFPDVVTTDSSEKELRESTSEYFTIQRKASQLSQEDQKLLIQMIDRTFNDVFKDNYEEDYDTEL